MIDLEQAAKWFDDEYAARATWRWKLRGHSEQQAAGYLAALAEAAAVLRQMASGKVPQHGKPYDGMR